MASRAILTLHAPLGRLLSDPVLEVLDKTLRAHGYNSWWISPLNLPDVTIIAEIDDDAAFTRELTGK